MNIYDLEHICTTHPKMSAEEWRGVYGRPGTRTLIDHQDELMRRAVAMGRNPKRIFEVALEFYGCYRYEKVHPLQGGFVRRKIPHRKAPHASRSRVRWCFPRRLVEFVTTYGGWFSYIARTYLLYRRVRRETLAAERPVDGRRDPRYLGRPAR